MPRPKPPTTEPEKLKAPKTPRKKAAAPKAAEPAPTEAAAAPSAVAPKKRVKLTDAAVPRQVDILDRTSKQSYLALRLKVRVFYDLQAMRLVVEGRTHAPPEGRTVFLHEADKLVLELRTQELKHAERHALSDIEEHLGTLGVYTQIFSDKKRFRGLGPTMWGVILSEFDIERSDTVSKMWAFSGLITTPCRRCLACYRVVTLDEKRKLWAHRAEIVRAASGAPIAPPVEDDPDAEESELAVDEEVEAEEIAADVDPTLPKRKKTGCEKHIPEAQTFESTEAMRPRRGERNKYNAWLRMKLVGVLAPVMLKLASPYRSFYDNYKQRIITTGRGINDGHRHRMAMRYMVKMLLLDIYKAWRGHEGLSIRDPWIEEFGGKKHVGGSGMRPGPGSADELSPEVLAELEQQQPSAP